MYKFFSVKCICEVLLYKLIFWFFLLYRIECELNMLSDLFIFFYFVNFVFVWSELGMNMFYEIWGVVILFMWKFVFVRLLRWYNI